MEQGQIHIRLMKAEEAEALTALSLRSKASWGYDAAFMKMCKETLTVTADLASRYPIWVADYGGAVVGTVSLEHDPAVSDAIALERLFVDPERFGQGIGHTLFQHAATHARDKGYRELRLLADPGAVPFYLRQGMIQIGDAPSDAIPGRRLPVMAMAL